MAFDELRESEDTADDTAEKAPARSADGQKSQDEGGEQDAADLIKSKLGEPDDTGGAEPGVQEESGPSTPEEPEHPVTAESGRDRERKPTRSAPETGRDKESQERAAPPGSDRDDSRAVDVQEEPPEQADGASDVRQDEETDRQPEPTEEGQDAGQEHDEASERYRQLKEEATEQRLEEMEQQEREENEADIYDPDEEGNILH